MIDTGKSFLVILSLSEIGSKRDFQTRDLMMDHESNHRKLYEENRD